MDDNDRPLWWKVMTRKYVVTGGPPEYWRTRKSALRRATELNAWFGGGYAVHWRFGEKREVQ